MGRINSPALREKSLQNALPTFEPAMYPCWYKSYAKQLPFQSSHKLDHQNPHQTNASPATIAILTLSFNAAIFTLPSERPYIPVWKGCIWLGKLWSLVWEASWGVGRRGAPPGLWRQCSRWSQGSSALRTGLLMFGRYSLSYTQTLRPLQKRKQKRKNVPKEPLWRTFLPLEDVLETRGSPLEWALGKVGILFKDSTLHMRCLIFQFCRQPYAYARGV